MQHHLAGGAVGVDGLDKGAIDLKRVQRQRLQAGQRRVAGAEIVNGDGEALAADGIEDRSGARPLQESALRSFDLDIFWQGAGGGEKPVEHLHRVLVAKVRCRHVDGNAEVRIELEELRQITADNRDHLLGDELDEAAFFGLRDEVIGPDFGVIASPADQSFGADDAASGKVNHWLIHDAEILFLDGAAQHGGEG